ncbi:MAG: hypothetical protein KKH75_05430 [Actinobacteria bacterium]|nr:hypothetical protein [Actinomycetota bacterium]
MTDAPIDPRPRPEYGEYATPEEQRARIQAPDVSAALDAGVSVQATPSYGEATGAVTRGVTSPMVAPASAPARPRNPRVDRLVTGILLGYGLFTVITSAVQLADFTGFATTWMATVQIPGTFTNIAQGQQWAIIGAVLFGAVWMLTALLSWRRLAKGRRAWWVPIVGAVVAYTALTLCLVVPLMGDPAIAAYISRLG